MRGRAMGLGRRKRRAWLGRLKAGGQGTRRAHVEHGVHSLDAGRVKAQRLVERRRVLPRVGRRACDAGRGARARRREGREAAAAHAACTGRARLKAGGQGMRGAHVEHVVHGRDAGRDEAQRLVERRRGLPSRKEGIRCGARCGPRAGGRWPAAAHEWHVRGEGPALKAGGGRGHAQSARRTWSACP